MPWTEEQHDRGIMIVLGFLMAIAVIPFIAMILALIALIIFSLTGYR